MVKAKGSPAAACNQKTASDVKRNTSSEEGDRPAGGIWQDERFQHLVADPRFRSLPKVQRKVRIDKRFQDMFTNEKFKVKYTVDKYGRRVNRSNAEDLRKYYELESSDEHESDDDNEEDDKKTSGEEEEEEERRKEEQAISRETDEESGDDENDALASDGEEVPRSLRERLLDPNIDYARGEGRIITDSSSDEETSEEEEPEMYIDHVWGELDADAETTDESTRRLAVCNMDWDRIRAQDLMVLFSSFLPPGGSILSVRIYPSEFGKERMAVEERRGPQELVGLDKGLNNVDKQEIEVSKVMGAESKANSDSGSDDDLVQEQDSDAGEGDDYHMEKLRQYQLKRLRYYYAVVECDSVETADKIYKECDGIEYESSATRVDLRFVPDETTFDDDEPTDECTELPDSSAYKPRQFTTTALQQAKVDLTWDETAIERRELGDKLASGKMDGISDKDLRKLVAYSSEEDDEAGKEDDRNSEESKTNGNEVKMPSKPKSTNKEEEVINKYKALLAEINEKEQKEKEQKKFEMEFSWNVTENKNEDEDEGNIENGCKVKQQPLTPIERVLQKRSEKNKKRKEERKKKKLQSKGIDPNDSELDSIPDGIDMNDPYFAEEFANGDFVDPKAKLKEKAKKEKQRQAEQAEEDEKQVKELQLLLGDEDEEDRGKHHFSLEKILKSEQETKSKKKRRKLLKKSKELVAEANKPVEDNFQLNVNDERFRAVYTSHLFNIDPTDPHFKKTKGMEQLIQEKLKRRHVDNDHLTQRGEQDNSQEVKKPKKQIENSLLVKNLKRKIRLKQAGK